MKKSDYKRVKAQALELGKAHPDWVNPNPPETLCAYYDPESGHRCLFGELMYQYWNVSNNQLDFRDLDITVPRITNFPRRPFFVDSREEKVLCYVQEALDLGKPWGNIADIWEKAEYHWQ